MEFKTINIKYMTNLGDITHLDKKYKRCIYLSFLLSVSKRWGSVYTYKGRHYLARIASELVRARIFRKKMQKMYLLAFFY